jgi:hypothetical protein
MASSAKAELLAASAAQDIPALVDLFERNGARKDELELGDVLATLSSKDSAKLWEGLEKAAMSVLHIVPLCVLCVNIWLKRPACCFGDDKLQRCDHAAVRRSSGNGRGAGVGADTWTMLSDPNSRQGQCGVLNLLCVHREIYTHSLNCLSVGFCAMAERQQRPRCAPVPGRSTRCTSGAG